MQLLCNYFIYLLFLVFSLTGEDIGESDDEEDDEKDELEYDDFLRQDTDFGSDADSDGEQASAAAIQRREGIETLGPRFLTSYYGNSGSSSAGSVSGLGVGSGCATGSGSAGFGVYGAERGERRNCAVKLDTEFNSVVCSEREKDVVRLRAYAAVVYAPQTMLPYLGGSSPVHSSSSLNAAAVKQV